jgi:hypothetical protein
MSPEDIYMADKLVEEWIEEKCEPAKGKDKSGWSKELVFFMNNYKSFLFKF